MSSNQEDIKPIAWHEIPREYRTPLTKIIVDVKQDPEIANANSRSNYRDFWLKQNENVSDAIIKAFTLGAMWKDREKFDWH